MKMQPKLILLEHPHTYTLHGPPAACYPPHTSFYTWDTVADVRMMSIVKVAHRPQFANALLAHKALRAGANNNATAVEIRVW